MEKGAQVLKDKLKKGKLKEREIHRQQLHKMKVRFPTHTTNMYIHSTQCCSHVLRILTQFHITVTYFLHVKSNNFNLFASKLPKAALYQEIRVRLEF